MDSLTGLLPPDIQQVLNLKQAYRSKQIFSWLQKGVLSFAEMTNLPADLRSELATRWKISSSVPDGQWRDEDNTIKYRFRLRDGLFIETVLLRDKNGRKTICVSTQVGCRMGCLFCRTGQMTFRRNLEAEEIVEQLLHITRAEGPVSHVVFMGMGEPLDNLMSVRQAVAVMRHPEGLGLGLRKITISTCGLIEPLRDLSTNGPQVRLAVSLISAIPDVRRRLMPVARSQSLEELRKVLMAFQAEGGKRVTLEVVLLKGINDGEEEINALRAFTLHLKAVVNVIPWNPATGLEWQRPDNARIEWFTRSLEAAGITVTRRYRRGSGINAACGQLCPDQQD